MASEVFMFVIENRYFQCINNTADCVDNTSCKQPSESGQRHIAENLCKCKDTRPSHSGKSASLSELRGKFYIKEPGSAITHFIGMIMALIAAFPLLIKAAAQPDPVYLISMSVYAASLILLYAASTTYHTFDISEKGNTVLKKIDHMMISVLIAGSYTPVCLLVLEGRMRIILLAVVWTLALTGILIKAFWVFCPKWVSSVLYIGMGWTCVLSFAQIFRQCDTDGRNSRRI